MAEKVLKKQDSATVPCIAQPSKQLETEHTATIWLVIGILTTLFGSGLPAGYCLGVINTPQEIIRAWLRTTVKAKSDYELSATEEMSVWAVIVSIYIVGAIIGAPSGPLLADKGGRRFGLFVNHLLCLFSALLCVWCKAAGSIHMLIFGRFISGICSGLSTSLMPMYLSEVAPSALRGVMAVFLPMTMCLGILISQILGMESILGTNEYWPYLIGGFGVPVLVALVLHPLLPESPAYTFIILGDEEKGRKALHRLRRGSAKAIESEVSSLKALMINDQNDGSTWGISTLISNKTFRLPLIITMVFNAAQQFSGINAVFYYSTLIFRSAGLNMHQSQGASIGAATINWIFSMLAIPLIRYSRRRVLLLTSIALCICCQAVLMTSLKLIPVSSFASYAAIAALMSFVLVYHLGIGPIPYMIATELFPSGPRSVGISLGSTSNWVSNLIVGFTFPLIQAQMGEFSFTIFIISSCLFWIFTYKFLPETLDMEDLSLSSSSSSSEKGHSDQYSSYSEKEESSEESSITPTQV